MTDTNENDFARLERHDGLQVLCYVASHTNETGQNGPCVFTRCDCGVTIETVRGPWIDDEAGWTAAEAFMRAQALDLFVAKAVEMVSQFAEDVEVGNVQH